MHHSLERTNNTNDVKSSLTKIITIAIVLIGMSYTASAQQEAQFTQYMFNRLSYNPAYAGSSGSICAMLLYRNQWLGLKLDKPVANEQYHAGSTPSDYLFSFDMPVKFLHGGIGLTVYAETIGYNRAISASIDYAFRMYWGPGNLSAAVEANLFNSTLDYSQLVGSDDFTGNYYEPVQSAGDPLLAQSDKQSDFLFDISTGLYYQIPGTFYVGLSAKNLLASKSETLNYQNSRVFYLHGGYEFVFPSNPSFKLKPSALVKTANFSVFQADISCLLDYQGTVWGGLSYRIFDAVSILAGVQWKKLQVGLAYDLTTTRLGTFKSGRSAGSIEIYLKYCFKVVIPQKKPSVYRNTRYLL